MHLKNRFFLLLLSAFFIFVDTCPAQTQTDSLRKTYIIAGISVEGNKFADESTVITLSGLRPGDNITLPGDDKLQQAVRNLWDRKQFSDINIVVDKITPVGIFLVIKVKEFDRLNKIIPEGNDAVDDNDIAKAFGKVKGDIVSPWDIYVAKRNIKAKYKAENLLFAKVDLEVMPTDTAQFVNVKVNVEEGVTYYVNKIDFVGNKYFSDKELASAMKKTHTKKWYEFWRSSKFNLENYQTSKKDIADFFRREGFIDGHIVGDTMLFDEANKHIMLQIKVDEGHKYYVRNIKFDGNTVFSDNALLKRLDFSKGDIYDQEKLDMNISVNKDFNDALSLYNDNGYMYAEINKEEHRIGSDSIDVDLNVKEGSRVKFRRIDIKGNSKTKDKVIRRELFTRPGDYFSRSSILRSIRALGVLNYFSPESLMKFEVNPVDEENVDITYNVEEQSTETFNASIGYAGSYGVTGAVGISFNNFSIAEPLRGGAGQVFNFQWEMGQSSRYESISLGFTEPWLNNKPTTIGFNIFDTKYNYIWNFRQTGIAINLGRRFKWPDDYFRADWGLRIKENNVDEQSGSSYYRPGKYTEITISQTLSRTSLNNTFFPTSGSKFSLATSWAMGAIGLGETDYLKTQMGVEFNEPLAKINGMDRLVFNLSSTIGYVSSLKYQDEVSPIELYKMGGNGLGTFGVTPLRGYSDESVGEADGGRMLIKHTAELRFALSQGQMPVYVYAFAEAGNVWSKLKEADPFTLNRSAGLGVQLMMNPIGVIGFSYGYGFDNENTSLTPAGWKFLFNLGNY